MAIGRGTEVGMTNATFLQVLEGPNTGQWVYTARGEFSLAIPDNTHLVVPPASFDEEQPIPALQTCTRYRVHLLGVSNGGYERFALLAGTDLDAWCHHMQYGHLISPGGHVAGWGTVDHTTNMLIFADWLEGQASPYCEVIRGIASTPQAEWLRGYLQQQYQLNPLTPDNVSRI